MKINSHAKRGLGDGENLACVVVRRPAPESTADLEDSMDFLLAWLISAIGIYTVAKILPGSQVPSVWDAVVVGIMFGAINFFLGWLVFSASGFLTLAMGTSSSYPLTPYRERDCHKSHRPCGASNGNCRDGQRRTCGADYQCGSHTGEYVDTSMRKSHSQRPASASSGVT